MKLLIVGVTVVTMFSVGRMFEDECLAQSKGTIKGIVVDEETRDPLYGANILALGTDKGAASNDEGRFEITGVDAGSYTLQAGYVGYQTVKTPDIIVRPSRITFVEVRLKPTTIEMQEVSVSAGYFSPEELASTGTAKFSFEEVRRAPGAAGDISRIVMVLPSVAKANDQSNSLIVRGGSPIENGFYIDGIEIPNINHFPAQGSSGGGLGIVNVDLIQDVEFSSGGFSAAYGNRLSSVMNISLRDGNRDVTEGQAELSMAGFGFAAEGPLPNESGAWILSARRSYTDLIVNLVDLTVAPTYGDGQFKLTYDIDNDNRLSVLNLFSLDESTIQREQAEKLDFSVYGKEYIIQNTSGVVWRRLHGTAGFSTATLSASVTGYRTTFYDGRAGSLYMRNRSTERTFRTTVSTRHKLGSSAGIEAGVNGALLWNTYDNALGEYTTMLGDTTPALNVTGEFNETELGGYLSLTTKLIGNVKVTAGIRGEYFSAVDRFLLSPRLDVSCSLNEVTVLTAGVGLYRQTLPVVILFQNPAHRSLRTPEAIHIAAGIHRMLTEDTKLTIEVYRKEYRNVMMDPTQPGLFVLDEILYRQPYFFKFENLSDAGKGTSQGIEATLQKKLAVDLYGIVSAAYFGTRYTGLDGIERPRVFDNRFIFNIEGGYKPNSEWEFSVRWVFAGGMPSTPFDMEESKRLNRGVFDASRINGIRLPDYHSLSVRVDKRFHFTQSNLILYLSVWNAYNRKNIASVYWNEFKNEPSVQYQWTLLPILGAEYEF